jgi:alcohol dehydrogenase class IV
MDIKNIARKILKDWKGDAYIFGIGILDKIGELTKAFGDNTLLIGSLSEWARKHVKIISKSLQNEGISYNVVLGARPNCPREDMYRMALQITKHTPDSVIAFGGGSTIDGVKAANVLTTYSPTEVSKILDNEMSESSSIDPYFGTGNVTKMKKATKRDLIPMITVQTASGSAAHLTKYSNITDPLIGQKKLIVDEAIVPNKAIFDYKITLGAPKNLTLDGGLDGLAHLWEVFLGATGKNYYDKLKPIVSTGTNLIVSYMESAIKDEMDGREGLGLGTDLGGYAIMIGGTNGPHLGSFSLVDILSHGRACAILYPYYTIFFSKNVQDQLKTIAPIFKNAGYIEEEIEGMDGRRLGEIVARGMINFNRSFGFPSTLKSAGATEKHLERMLKAAKDPQLKMKLLNMPVPLDPEKGDVERYMNNILSSAYSGDFNQIELKPD